MYVYMCILQSHCLALNVGLQICADSSPCVAISLPINFKLLPVLTFLFLKCYSVTLFHFPPSHTLSPTHPHTPCLLERLDVLLSCTDCRRCPTLTRLPPAILFTCMPRDTSESPRCIKSCLTLLQYR